MKGRDSFDGQAVYHIYQRTKDGFLLFYRGKDYIIFYTMVAVAAHRYGIKVLGFCQMVDHTHLLVKAPSLDSIRRFVQHYNKSYTVYFHQQYGTNGELFDGPFGIAKKVGAKAIRTAIAYLYNNPVEKKLCRRAEEYHWNYLAYADNPYPFSERRNLAHSSNAFRRAIRIITDLSSRNRPLNGIMLSQIEDTLNPEEIKRLVDRIVGIYKLVDYSLTLSFYGDYDTMLLAFHSNTGSEYDIDEEFSPESDTIYYRIAKAAVNLFGKDCFNGILSATEAQREKWAARLANYTRASRRQLFKFLHLPRPVPVKIVSSSQSGCLYRVGVVNDTASDQSEQRG